MNIKSIYLPNVLVKSMSTPIKPRTNIIQDLIKVNLKKDSAKNFKKEFFA